MLTVLTLFVPGLKEKYYAIMVDWCIEKSAYYSDIDVKKSAYWAKQACKYLLKRLDAVSKMKIL